MGSVGNRHLSVLFYFLFFYILRITIPVFFFYNLVRKMGDRPKKNEGQDGPKRGASLNERILSSMSRRSAAAHPWHDLDIGACLSTVLMLIS